MLNLANQPVRAITKEMQTHKHRIKPTRRQRSECPPKEVIRLKQRSGGVCEKCDLQRATGKAHIERRWKSEDIPTAEDFVHLCTVCHTWCDSCDEGRQWLIDFQKRLLEVSK